MAHLEQRRLPEPDRCRGAYFCPPASWHQLSTHTHTTPSLASEDDGYAKAYFRRAVLHGCLGEYGAAAEDLAACAQLDPTTEGECERELRRMEKRAVEEEAQQRSTLKGFFDRGSA